MAAQSRLGLLQNMIRWPSISCLSNLCREGQHCWFAPMGTSVTISAFCFKDCSFLTSSHTFSILAWIFAVMFAFTPLSHINAFDTKADHFVFFSLLTEASLLSCYNNQANSRTGSWFPSCKEVQQNGSETEALSTEAPCPEKKWLLPAFLAQMGEEGHHLKAGINPGWTEPWITIVAKEKEGTEIQKQFFLSRLHSSQFTYGSYTIRGYNAENLLSETPSNISTHTFCGWLCMCIVISSVL